MLLISLPVPPSLYQTESQMFRMACRRSCNFSLERLRSIHTHCVQYVFPRGGICMHTWDMINAKSPSCQLSLEDLDCADWCTLISQSWVGMQYAMSYYWASPWSPFQRPNFGGLYRMDVHIIQCPLALWGWQHCQYFCQNNPFLQPALWWYVDLTRNVQSKVKCA
jgi:hypothetical protein